MSIKYGSAAIEYNLIRSKRKTLGIIVTPEAKTFVKTPTTASLSRIEAIVKKRASWILKQKSMFLAYYPKQLPKQYISGEIFLYPKGKCSYEIKQQNILSR